MKPLRQAIDDYLRLRRSLGFKLRDRADDLRDFASFLEQKAAPFVTTELAMEWAMQPADPQPSDGAQRLSFVCVFARHWHATAKQSSARRAWFRCTRPLGTSGPITPGAATGFCATHRLPASFSTITAAVWTALRFVERSTICRGRSACAGRRITRVRGFTIFGTDSPSARWSSGIGPTRISSGACRCCLRSWGTRHVADTYWCLSVEPERMGLATRRLELRWGLTHEE